MFCKHHYQYTQGHFVCAKCGNRRYSSRVGRRGNKKKIAIPIIITSIALLAIVVYFGDISIPRQISESPIRDIPKIADDVREKIPEIEEKLGQIRENVDSISKSIPKEIPQVPTVTKSELSLAELKQIALDDINKYRIQNGLSALSLGSAVSPQLYSEELLVEGCIHHVSDRGEGPMLRYKNNGDRMFLVAENISGGLGTSWESPQESIINGNYQMMFDDAASNWGHRDNILGPDHRSVSIGIAYDSQRLVMVQDFESVLPPGYQYDPSSFMKEPVDERNCW